MNDAVPLVPLALDPTTLLFAISVLGFATAAFAFSASRAVGAGQAGLVEWGQAMLAVGASFLLYFFRGHVPVFLTYVVATLMVMAVAVFGLLAQTRLFGTVAPRRTIAVVCVFGMSGVSAGYAFNLPLGVGVFTMSIAMAALLAMSGRLIIQKNGLRATAPSTFAAAMILLLAVVCVIRALVAVAGAGASVSMASGRSLQAWPLVVGMLFVVGATIGFVMMVHDKHRRIELQNSRRDELTGLHTRAAFFDAAQAVQAQSAQPYALVVVDVDRFKDINDSHGHSGGDSVLAQVGRLVLRSIRSHDIAGRYGGDEFCIVLRGCGQAEAQLFSERLVSDASQLVVQLPSGEHIGFTLSAGYATRLPGQGGEMEPTERLFDRADAALYQAKRGGRRRAVAAADVPAAASAQ
jgi:diguanylate cyclase (GGDEF)-like protein